MRSEGETSSSLFPDVRPVRKNVSVVVPRHSAVPREGFYTRFSVVVNHSNVVADHQFLGVGRQIGLVREIGDGVDPDQRSQQREGGDQGG